MGVEKKLAGETELVGYIVKYRDEHGIPPSLRTIAAHFGVGLGTAHTRVNDLIARKALAWTDTPVSMLRVTEVGMKMVTEPMS